MNTIFESIKDIFSSKEREGTSLEEEKQSIQWTFQKERLKLEIEIVDWERKKELVESIMLHKQEKFNPSLDVHERVERIYNNSRYFMILWNIYGRIWNETWKLWEYFKVDWTKVEFLFNLDKLTPPFEWMEEDYKNFHENVRRQQRAWSIFYHNNILEKEWYSYLLDDKWIYRLFNKKDWIEKQGLKWVEWYRYTTIQNWTKAPHDFEKANIIEYWQEVPKESEEYYNLMQKLRTSRKVEWK